MRLFKWLGSVLAAGVILAVALVGAARLVDFTLPFGTETIDRSQPALLKSIEDISEYHAAVGNFEVVVDEERDVRFVPSFIAGERSLFVGAGTVDAYVDFAGLDDGDLVLSADKATVQVRLPEAELSEPNLDQDRSYLFSQDRGVVDRVGSVLSTEDQQQLYLSAEEKLAEAAEGSELRDQAERNTRDMLKGFFAALDIEVTFVEE